MRAEYRAAIVGAGPAGSCAANALLLAGADGIVLVDRETFPRDKCCGDGLGGGVIEVLDRLDLAEVLDGHDRLKTVRINFHDRARVVIDTDAVDRPSPLGYVIRRREFDDRLAKKALSRGAADLTGWGLDAAEWTGAHWRLDLERAATGERRTITADVLVGADGARSRVRRVLSQPFNGDRHTAIAVRAYVDAHREPRGYQQFDFIDGMPFPGYAWIFSDGHGRANVGLGVAVDAYKADGARFEDLLSRYCAHLGGQVLSTPVEIETAILPLGSQRPALSFVDRPAALVGDAGSMINPALGEGIFYAMYGGLLLGERLAPALSGRGDVRTALAAFEREFTRQMASGYRDARLLTRVVSHKAVLGYLIRRYADDPDFCYDLNEMIMGIMPPRRSPTIPRLLARTLLPRLFQRKPRPARRSAGGRQ